MYPLQMISIIIGVPETEKGREGRESFVMSKTGDRQSN